MNPPLCAAAAAFLVMLAAHPAHARIPAIEHIVIVVQENRTPDNLFHDLPKYLPHADIASFGIDSQGFPVVLTPERLANTYDLSHEHHAFESMYDNGRMDGADQISCLANPGTTCPDYPQFKYAQPSDVAPYLQIAIHYGFANRMFQSNQGPSFPAHQFLLSGTSAPSENTLDFVAENPVDGDHQHRTGCIAPSNERVAVIGPDGIESRSIYPCFEHKTLTDVIDTRPDVSWRYYTPTAGSIWTAPNAIRHMCKPSTGGTPICTGSDWTHQSKIVLDPAGIIRDIKGGRLRSVSWVIPTGLESDHASYNDGSGPSWVAAVVNAVGRSKYWDHTAVLIMWDDWGGWYDHVAPPIDKTYGYYESGFRVPLLVVSPYTPAGYISDKTHTFGSVLKFVETTFGLPLIPPGTYVDARSDDLLDFFDFTKPRRKFVPIPAPISEDSFLNDRRPKTDPDDD